MARFPPCPPSLRHLVPYLNIGEDHESKDLIVCYWTRLFTLRHGVKTSRRASPEAHFLFALMTWVKMTKRQNRGIEAIINEVTGKAHMENYCLQVFLYADQQFRASNLEKNVVKAFWTCGFLYEVLQIFGPVSGEAAYKGQYAKLKAAQIHKRLKSFDVPLVGPDGEEITPPDEGALLTTYRVKTMENPACPLTLKPIHHYLKIGQEHDMRDVVVSYWAHLYALQVGVNLSQRREEEAAFLLALMNWLKTTKRANMNNEAITTEGAAKAHVEEYTHRLFTYADKQYREANFGKGTIKAFWTSGYLYDILQIFGKLSGESIRNGVYAKAKASYIYKTLKRGRVPVIEPMPEEVEVNSGDDEGEEDASNYRLSLKFILIK